MEDLKIIVASNISRLRKSLNLTQAELAEKINYSDKSISKWERAEALPDLAVTKQLAEFFGVSVDFLLTTHDEWRVEPPKPSPSYDSDIITSVAILGIWAVALLVFLVLHFTGTTFYDIFYYSVVASFITLLVLNNVWKKTKYNLLIVSLLVLSVFLTIYLSFLSFLDLNLWEIVFLLALCELIVYLSFKIRKRAKKKDDKTA